MTPSPPMPFIAGSTTQSMYAAATAASTAFPPPFNMATPASPMRGCLDATIPFSATQSRLPAPTHRLSW